VDVDAMSKRLDLSEKIVLFESFGEKLPNLKDIHTYMVVG
jgi:hypothetical protein